MECLIRHRAQRGGTRYVVQCMGYGPEHDDWIHEQELGHAKAIVDQYKRANELE